MKNFKELDKRTVSEVEKTILENWKKQDILNKTIENRTGKSDWVFFDGPATANGMPGLHHMVSKFLKDKEGLVNIYEHAMKIKIDKL